MSSVPVWAPCKNVLFTKEMSEPRESLLDGAQSHSTFIIILRATQFKVTICEIPNSQQVSQIPGQPGI